MDLDAEWIHLMLAAKKAGIQAEEIRRFFAEQACRVIV